MKVTGLNGREYNLNLKKYIVYKDDTKKKSKYHLLARKIIREMFTGCNILEEVKLPGSTASHKRSVLYLDFLIQRWSIAVEVHGQQHYEFCPFFHKTEANFLKAQVRDEDKAQWCLINKLHLIILKHSDTENEWKQSLSKRS